jgi:AcrR family transcriptional regulator
MVAREETLRDRQRAQIRADIRRAAFRLFAERGYDAVTTEEIAAAAGVAPRTFFRHVATKEELVLGPARHGGAAIVTLLEQRPSREAPDTALINAIIARTAAFQDAESEDWRETLLMAPELLDKVTMLTAADKERAVKLIADRMQADTAVDMRPGLLVQLAFAAADFGFQQWIRQSLHHPKPLQLYVSQALEAIKSRRWRPQSAGI